MFSTVKLNQNEIFFYFFYFEKKISLVLVSDFLKYFKTSYELLISVQEVNHSLVVGT